MAEKNKSKDGSDKATGKIKKVTFWSYSRDKIWGTQLRFQLADKSQGKDEGDAYSLEVSDPAVVEKLRSAGYAESREELYEQREDAINTNQRALKPRTEAQLNAGDGKKERNTALTESNRSNKKQ